jgi:hypothetical protein
MTPLYYDPRRNGLTTSKDGQLKECCCCQYCCNKFGTGGENQPTILLTETNNNNPVFSYGGASYGNWQYFKVDINCPYDSYFSPLGPYATYHLYVTSTNNVIANSMGLILYCSDYLNLDPYSPASRNFNLDLIGGDLTLESCGSFLFPQGQTILRNGPCGDSFNAVFGCEGTEGKVAIWKI